MKEKKSVHSLKLNKQTISRLNNSEMSNEKGGTVGPGFPTNGGCTGGCTDQICTLWRICTQWNCTQGFPGV